MTYSCSDFTDEIMQWLGEHLDIAQVDDDDPEQQSIIALAAINSMFEAGGALASIVDAFLNGQGTPTVDDMNEALTQWQNLIHKAEEPKPATCSHNHFLLALARISLRLRNPKKITDEDRGELRAIIKAAISFERQAQKRSRR